MRTNAPIERAGRPTMTKSSSGARRAYLSASAESTELGDRVFYSRSSETEPAEWGRIQRETEELAEILADESRQTRDRERLERIEKRIEENRERAEEEWRARGAEEKRLEAGGDRAEPARVRTRDSRGRRISASSPPSPTETTYSISVGLGDLSFEDLAEEISARILGGARISRGLGVWDGVLEDCALVTHYGGSDGAEELLEILAEILPDEKVAAIEIGSPRILFEELDEYRKTEPAPILELEEASR